MHVLLKPVLDAKRSLVAGSIRELVFGVEDGVVQNLTLVAGMVGAQLGSRVIAIVAAINGIAGVVSMSMGTYLSSKAEQEVATATGEPPFGSIRSPLRDAVVMASAYALGASVPIIPFAIGVASVKTALGLAMMSTAAALFGLGMLKATLSRQERIRSGLEMLLLASAAGLTGYLLGFGARALFGLDV